MDQPKATVSKGRRKAREAASGIEKDGCEIHREESEIGTTSQPHAPTDPNMPQANGR